MTGDTGNDLIFGGAGNDIISGGSGTNLLVGGTGDDTITGGAGADWVDYSAAGSAVTVNLSTVTAQNTVGDGTDTITAVENLTGSAFNDTLTGDGNANIITGGGGNDTMVGGLGIDTVDYSSAGAGVTVNLTTTIGQNTVGAGTDTISGFENLNGSMFNDTLTGDAADNVIEGNAGTNSITGGDGSDTFIYLKGDGTDTVAGGAGVSWTDTIDLNNGTIVARRLWRRLDREHHDRFDRQHRRSRWHAHLVAGCGRHHQLHRRIRHPQFLRARAHHLLTRRKVRRLVAEPFSGAGSRSCFSTPAAARLPPQYDVHAMARRLFARRQFGGCHGEWKWRSGGRDGASSLSGGITAGRPGEQPGPHGESAAAGGRHAKLFHLLAGGRRADALATLPAGHAGRPGVAGDSAPAGRTIPHRRSRAGKGDKTVPAAVVLWASVSPEVDKRLMETETVPSGWRPRSGNPATFSGSPMRSASRVSFASC